MGISRGAEASGKEVPGHLTLIQENERLKRLLAERDMEIDAIKEMLKNVVVVAERREAAGIKIGRGVSARRSCSLLGMERKNLRYESGGRGESSMVGRIK